MDVKTFRKVTLSLMTPRIMVIIRSLSLTNSQYQYSQHNHAEYQNCYLILSVVLPIVAAPILLLKFCVFFLTSVVCTNFRDAAWRHCCDEVWRRWFGAATRRRRRRLFWRTRRDGSGSRKRARAETRIPISRRPYHWLDSRSIYSFSICIL